MISSTPQTDTVHVIGGGLAGSEAAWQVANAGVRVVLHEMRPLRMTEAHRTEGLAELVCSNSFRSDDAANNARLLRDLETVPDAERSARYRCAMVYLRWALDPAPLVCQASWEGRIGRLPRGRGGFGYDPLFLVDDGPQTAAELEVGHKNEISHRGRALRALVAELVGDAP